MIFQATLNNIKNRCEDIDTMIEAAKWGKPMGDCLDIIKKCTDSIRLQVDCIELEIANGPVTSDSGKK